MTPHASPRFCPNCGKAAKALPYCTGCGFHLAGLTQPPGQPGADAPVGNTADTSDVAGPAVDSSLSGQTTSGPPSSLGAPGPDHPVPSVAQRLRKLWSGLDTVSRAALAGGAGVVAVVAVILIATGGGHGNSIPNSSGNNADTTGGSGVSAAQVCVDKWNAGASQVAKQIAGNIAVAGQTSGGPKYTYVSAGFSADVPDRCLITVANVDVGLVSQFQEKSGGVFDVPLGGSSSVSTLPDSVKQWNAHGDTQGTLGLGAP